MAVRGRPLVVIGQEAPWLMPGPDLKNCPESAGSGRAGSVSDGHDSEDRRLRFRLGGGGPFRLCLSHTPDNIAWARQHGIDLMLSGHVHGGQVRLPLIGSVFVPSQLGRRYDCGTYSEGPTLLHVSRGLSGEHQVRFLCRPEATLLRLRSPS
jgi:hypothetical protein